MELKLPTPKLPTLSEFLIRAKEEFQKLEHQWSIGICYGAIEARKCYDRDLFKKHTINGETMNYRIELDRILNNVMKWISSMLTIPGKCRANLLGYWLEDMDIPNVRDNLPKLLETRLAWLDWMIEYCQKEEAGASTV